MSPSSQPLPWGKFSANLPRGRRAPRKLYKSNEIVMGFCKCNLLHLHSPLPAYPAEKQTLLLGVQFSPRYLHHHSRASQGLHSSAPSSRALPDGLSCRHSRALSSWLPTLRELMRRPLGVTSLPSFHLVTWHLHLVVVGSICHYLWSWQPFLPAYCSGWLLCIGRRHACFYAV